MSSTGAKGGEIGEQVIGLSLARQRRQFVSLICGMSIGRTPGGVSLPRFQGGCPAAAHHEKAVRSGQIDLLPRFFVSRRW